MSPLTTRSRDPAFDVKHDDALHGLLADRCQSFGVTLPVGAADRLIALVGRIASEPQNLTRILDPAAAVDRHLADSLVAIGAGAIASNGHLIDIGSGAGFPGLALAIACPDLDVTLLEAEARKADWLRRASAGLPNVSVIHDRAEVLALRRRGPPRPRPVQPRVSTDHGAR